MNKKSSRFLSVIVPAYKQEKTIVGNIQRIVEVLDTLTYPYEVIVVIDGMEDKTFAHAKTIVSSHVKIVGYNYNHGKGYALRYGIARSRGDIIAFIDSGSDLNPKGLTMLLAHFEWYDADIIVGSKWHPVSIVTYPLWRKILSKGYGMLVKLLFNVRVRDTQLGMKCFRREVLETVMPRLLVKKYAFDIEMLAVAQRLGFTRMYEAPVELNWSQVDSHISKNIMGNTLEMFIDTLAVYYRLNILKYYDNESKRKWRFDPDLNFRVNVG